jgi:hypothetical protein
LCVSLLAAAAAVRLPKNAFWPQPTVTVNIACLIDSFHFLPPAAAVKTQCARRMHVSSTFSIFAAADDDWIHVACRQLPQPAAQSGKNGTNDWAMNRRRRLHAW